MARGENCLIAVAGAPTAVTNSAIAGIIDEIGGASEIADVYGAISGLQGVLDGRIVDLSAQKRKVIEGLRRTPGSVLSGRYRFFNEADGTAFINALRAQSIGTLFLLGGLPAIELAKFAAEAAKAADYELIVLAVPLSAENEVNAGDHTPGYGSAARFAAIATRDAGRGAQGGEEPIVVLEFGGAGSGWLAASSILARDAQNSAPHSILLPEKAVDVEELVEEARRAYQKYGYAVIVTTDGAKDLEGESLDCATLTDVLSDKLNLPARFDKLGLSASVSGANVARADSDEAYGLGGLVVRLADDGTSGYAVALKREGEVKGERGYKVVESSMRFEEIEEFPRSMPANYLAESGSGVSDAFIEWVKPLIGGALPEYTALV
jgi:6-phosphofructokinase 1